MAKTTRREFLKKSAVLGATAYGIGRLSGPLFGFPGTGDIQELDLALVEGPEAASNVRKAVELIGGISRFVGKGDIVVAKPNISWDRLPEQGANTNPEVVAEVVKMCLEAGAKKVKVFDRTCNQAKRCYLRSGIEKAAKNAGAEVSHVHSQKFKSVSIPDGEILKSWEIYRDVLEADVIINLPILKSHSVSRVTMGFKNLMGFLGGDRGKIHNKFDQKIVDINTAIKPQLTILDATRILLRNGPQGGNLADVKDARMVAAGVDRVAVDALGATLFGLEPQDIRYLKIAHTRGLGEMNLDRIKLKRVQLDA